MFKIINRSNKVIASFDSIEEARDYIANTDYAIQYGAEAIEAINND
jgi:hypothetical protein